jgi:hypothetical protein
MFGPAPRVDSPLAPLLSESLPPALQVGLARIQPIAVLGFRAHANVHVRVGPMIMQHHRVLAVVQLHYCELASRALNGERVGAARHRHGVGQHSVVTDAQRKSPEQLPSFGADFE